MPEVRQIRAGRSGTIRGLSKNHRLAAKAFSNILSAMFHQAQSFCSNANAVATIIATTAPVAIAVAEAVTVAVAPATSLSRLV